MEILVGRPVSPGYAKGTAVLFDTDDILEVPKREIRLTEVEEELDRLEGLDRPDVFLGEIAGAQGRHRDRCCLHGRFALFGSDDDLLQPGILGRRVAGGGCDCRYAEGRGAQQRCHHRRSKNHAFVCCAQHLFHVRISLKPSKNGRTTLIARYKRRRLIHPFALIAGPLAIGRLNS